VTQKRRQFTAGVFVSHNGGYRPDYSKTRDKAAYSLATPRRQSGRK